MTIIDTARESARHTNGRFGAQEHSLPETGLPIGVVLSGLAANTIRIDAPIGAVKASAYVNEDGQLVFSRYIDSRGLTVYSDARDSIDDAFHGADIEAFAAEYDVTERDVDGERWFDIDVED